MRQLNAYGICPASCIASGRCIERGMVRREQAAERLDPRQTSPRRIRRR